MSLLERLNNLSSQDRFLISINSKYDMEQIFKNDKE